MTKDLDLFISQGTFDTIVIITQVILFLPILLGDDLIVGLLVDWLYECGSEGSDSMLAKMRLMEGSQFILILSANGKQ